MIETDIIEVEKGFALGVRIQLGLPLILIKAEKGFIGCGYFNPDALERFDETAAIVSGVKTFEDVLNTKVKWVSSKARELGISEGMSGREALNKLV